MICIKCSHPKTKITNSRSRKRDASTWRRHQCTNCKTVFSTEERPTLGSGTLVHHEDGNTTLFSIGQLTLSIAAAFIHQPQKGSESAYDLARTIEYALVSMDPRIKLTSSLIRELTYDTLLRFDRSAAILYSAQHGVVTT